MSEKSASENLSSRLAVPVTVFVIVLLSQFIVHAVFARSGLITIATVALTAAVAMLGLCYYWPQLFHPSASSAEQAPAVAAIETDTVSGVLSLRSLTISLLESMALAERYSRELSVVQIVIDEFDSLQSRFGSSGIDAAAALLGSTIRDAVRMPDRVGRYAPNSFILVLPETQASGARQFSERIRRLVVEQEIRAGSRERFSISVSAGVARFESGDDPQRIIDRAEKAIQEAQSLGGNRTLVYDGSATDA